jgi:hypothetical protein
MTWRFPHPTGRSREIQTYPVCGSLPPLSLSIHTLHLDFGDGAGGTPWTLGRFYVCALYVQVSS